MHAERERAHSQGRTGRGRVAVVAESLDDVLERPGAGRQGRELRRPLGPRRRHGSEPDARLPQRFVELPGGDGPFGSAGRERRRRGAEKLERVGDSVQDASGQDGRGQTLQAGLLERDQVRGQVAAVDRRDVARLERREVVRAVPVVEVPAEALETLDRGEGRLQPIRHVGGPDPTEVVGGDRREQGEADVRRRGPACRLRLRRLLEVVGGQVVELRAGEPLEVAPRPARDRPELPRLLRREARRRGLAGGQADPARDQGRQEPDGRRRARRTPGRPAPTRRRARPRPPPAGSRRASGDRSRPPPGRARGGPARPAPTRAGGAARRRGATACARPRRSASRPCAPGKRARSAACERPMARSVATPRRKLRLATPRRFGSTFEKKDRTGGSARTLSTNAVHRPGADTGEAPAGQQRREGRRRREAAPQVVDHLPAPDRRDRVGRAAPRRRPGRSGDPGQQLPVAPDPPVLARDRHFVVAREPFEELDVRNEAGPGEEPLEEVVGELRVLRHPVVERPLERVHVVDALAREDPLAEEILVDVGDREGVQVDAARSREDELKERAQAHLGQRRRHAGLEDAVSLHDPGAAGVEARNG